MLLLLAANGCIDYYIYRQIKEAFLKRWPLRLHICISAAGILIFAAIVAIPTKGNGDSAFNSLVWLLLSYFAIYVPKYIFFIFDLAGRIPQLFKRKRIRLLTITGIVLGASAFLLMWWGALVNRFRIDTVHVNVQINGLPQHFDGYRIVQISDLHVGTFGSDTSFIDRLVNKINSLEPDLILFTGDIVNRHAEELAPFTESLSKLKAKDGELAILGNHDYSDYYNFHTEEERVKDREKLKKLYRLTSFELLDDEYRVIRHGSDSIIIIGVGNIGTPPFAVYGSIREAYPDTGDKTVKILMSHDPTHWVDSIADNDSHNIALTLSGHTHAMQIKFGRFSPAALRYKTWGGLYSDLSGRHQIYVNIGAGTVGPPMRIGATPEITLITLKKK